MVNLADIISTSLGSFPRIPSRFPSIAMAAAALEARIPTVRILDRFSIPFTPIPFPILDEFFALLSADIAATVDMLLMERNLISIAPVRMSRIATDNKSKRMSHCKNIDKSKQIVKNLVTYPLSNPQKVWVCVYQLQYYWLSQQYPYHT